MLALLAVIIAAAAMGGVVFVANKRIESVPHTSVRGGYIYPSTIPQRPEPVADASTTAPVVSA